ncbi:protein NO VEIN domain-containing protein [Chloroflexota bacterium]
MTRMIDKEWFPMSKSQWDFAHNMGEKFHIYRIYGVGQTEPPPPIDVVNPYERWIEGHLTAYPIGIRL